MPKPRIDVRKVPHTGGQGAHYESVADAHFDTLIATLEPTPFFREHGDGWRLAYGGLTRGILAAVENGRAYDEVGMKKGFLWRQGGVLDPVPSRIYTHAETRALAMRDASVECHARVLEDCRAEGRAPVRNPIRGRSAGMPVPEIFSLAF